MSSRVQVPVRVDLHYHDPSLPPDRPTRPVTFGEMYQLIRRSTNSRDKYQLKWTATIRGETVGASVLVSGELVRSSRVDIIELTITDQLAAFLRKA